MNPNSTGNIKRNHTAGSCESSPDLGQSRPWSGSHSSVSLEGEREAQSVSTIKVYHKGNLYEDWWVWEVLGVALSLLFMGGIVTMLSQIDGKRLDKWNFFFQPNAIVSTFVVVAKTTMLVAVSESLSQLKWLYFFGGRRSLGDFEAFDGASRGPWGALSFFWRMRLKVAFALVGSVVMILSLAMGPFAQQIISFPVRYVQSVDEVAAINVTSHFTRGKPFLLWKCSITPS